MTKLIPSGTVQLTVPTFPIELGKLPIESFIAAQLGTAPERFVSDIPSKYGTVDSPTVISKQNAASYQPQF